MAIEVATHNGGFHADDVLAYALIRAFMDRDATLVRTRDNQRIDQADVVIDVGGIYDPALRRFDHHQKSYTGQWSSAGMVLDWLCQQSLIQPGLGAMLQTRIVAYVDAVDNGRVEPRSNVPCFANIVSACNRGSVTLDEFDDAFLRAVDVASLLIAGTVAEHRELAEAETIVRETMDKALATGSNLLELPRYVPWKPAYFALGGQTHPTDFVIMPGLDGSWRAVAIPPEDGSFAQKRPLPAAWAGLSDDDLVAACGVPGARFCHKNRFIIVFDSRPHLLQALEVGGMLGDKFDG
ncbi:MAG: MYG1 family protein [Oligoflexia bacterium]|nr:MYG1 family protein [Oligoflexia bacterium]